ncbi:MAG: hypothetical protein KatS3mg115_0695 [Candidatus Poribacteria bacterium]|nr:MAG: hypothetical protein KatS3mg115_0695 [Candidatus Poribacteria bacterium]
MKLSQQRRPLWCLSFLLGCLGALTTALAAPTVRLEVEDPLLEVGEEFTLELIVENVERLFGASLKIVFDPLRVDYLSAEPGELFLDGIEPPFLSVRESGDTLAVSTSRRVGDVEVSGSGALVLLRFRAIGAGVVNWTILPETVVLLDSQGAPVPGSGNVSLGGFGALVGDGLFLLSSEIVSRSPLVFSASGFAPNEPVRMAVDDAELAEPAIASRDGELVNVSANLPLIPGGEHRFSLRGVDSGRSYEAPFVVLPRLGRTAPFVLAPDGSRVYTQPGWGGTQVGPGDLVELIADGFGAEEDVRITVNGARVSTFLDPSRTDALGVLRTAVELPRELAGPDALLLLEGSRSRLRLEAPPNRWRIQPRITSLTPPVGGLGTRVRLTASGFTPGEVVDLYVNERLVGGVSGAVANTRGSISINLFIDEALVDRHVYTHFAIVLRGETGSAADGTFAYAPTATITDITPAGGDLNVSPGEEVRVRGFGFPPGAAVSLRFGDREVPVSAQVDADGNLDLTFVVPTLPFGRYDLTVRAGSAETTPRETLQIVGTILRATLEGGSTPEIGGFGTLLVVEGAGFEPDETVQFDLGSRRGVHQTRTQADGTFRAGIIIPELPNDLPDGRGTVPLRASTRRTSAEVPVFIAAPAPVDQFLQTAELTVTPSEAAVGETVRVRGIGFPANYLLGVLSLDTGLEARFSPTPLRIAEVRAGANTINGILTDGNGVFEVDVLLTDLGADGIGGEKEIFPTRPTGDDGRPLLAVPFRLKPFAQLIDAVGRPVTTVRPRSPVLVQAAGFAPGERVQARIGNSFMVVEEPTDAFGRLVRASLQIGDVPGGEQTLSLLGLSSGVEAQIPVVVQSELRLVSPPAGTLVRPGDLIQVEGIGFPDGTVSFRIGEVPLTGTAVPINGFFVMSLFVPSVPLPTQAPITAAIGETTVASTSGTLRFATSQLTLEPTEGRVGTVVHVRGANGTGVLFGELVIGSLRNSQLVDGLWVGDFFVPPVPGGRYPVRVGVLPEGVQPPEFTVLPTLSVEPKALQIGEELTISGSAFRANSRVTISIGNAQTPYLAQSDPSGSFSLTVPVPRTNGDGVDVVATDGRLFVRERIEVLPLLVRVTAETSESGRVPVGADLTVEAAGLGPEEPVDVWLGPVPVQPRRPFTTTVDGSLLATFSMPPIPAGPQRVRVVGRHSGLTAEREGAVQVLPQLERPRPTTGAVGDTIELEGYGFAAGEGLEVRLGDQPIGEATADAFGRLSAEVLIRRALPDGEYPLIVVGRRSGLELTAPEPFRVRDTRRPVIERLELTPLRRSVAGRGYDRRLGCGAAGQS